MTGTAELLGQLDPYCRYLDSGYSKLSRRIVAQLHGHVVSLLPTVVPRDEPCEILLLSPSASWGSRIGRLTAALTDENVAVRHVVQPRERHILTQRIYHPSPDPVPPKWRFLAGYAEWLFETYRPRLLVTFTDHDPLSLFLKLSAERRGAKVANVAHSILVPHVLKSMFCFDYYLVFGQSSVDNARRSQVRFGDSQLIKTGNVLVDPAFQVPTNRDWSTVLFFSSRLYQSDTPRAMAYDQAARMSFGVVAAWARRQTRYQVLVKTHPDEDPAVIRKILAGIPRVHILPPGTSIRSALMPASLALGIVTNAALEAALMRRPCLTVFPPGVLDNHLELEDFFGPRLFSADALEAGIEDAFAQYDKWLGICDSFVARHLEHPFDGLAETVRTLVSILRGREDFDAIPMPGSVEALGSM